MPWHAKPDGCRRKVAARRRVPRLAHARTYVTRHIAPGWDVMSHVCRAAYAGVYANRHYRPRPAGRPSIRRVLYAVACAARRIRTARTPCAATGPCRFRARIPAGLESGGVGIRNRDTPGRTTPTLDSGHTFSPITRGSGVTKLYPAACPSCSAVTNPVFLFLSVCANPV